MQKNDRTVNILNSFRVNHSHSSTSTFQKQSKLKPTGMSDGYSSTNLTLVNQSARMLDGRASDNTHLHASVSVQSPAFPAVDHMTTRGGQLLVGHITRRYRHITTKPYIFIDLAFFFFFFFFGFFLAFFDF